MGVPSGGQQLGSARGSITINVQSVLAAQQTVMQASRQITRAFGTINTGTTQAQQGIGGLASAFNSLGNAVGITLSLGTAIRALGAAVEATQLATAFERQSLAATKLAGSQTRLNQLLKVYDSATGGIIDKATALSDVTRLMAVGFADSAEELDEFVRAVRGISIATGRPQEFIVTQLQIELLNQTGLRLDQIGLGMAEVKKRADELRAANNALTSEQAYQQAVLDTANEKFGDLTRAAESQATEVEKLSKKWRDLRLELGQELKEPVEETSGALSDLLDWLEKIRTLNRQMGEEALRSRKLQEGASLTIGSRTTIGRIVPEAFGPTPTVPGAQFTQEQINTAAEHARAVRDIERQANLDRLEATRQFEEQRASIVRQYGLAVAREAEDFATSRRRQEEDFNKSILGIRRDGARREARAIQDLQRDITRAQEDSTERIAELREDANKRLAEIDEDFKRDQERREQDFRDDMLSAAGRLDAIALLELRKDRARQLQDARRANEEQKSDLKEQLEERIQDEQEALDERTRQAKEAFDRQLADARQADEERLADMQADQELRQRREDEDRAVRLQRMAEDHALQLAELARQNALRMAQIDAQEKLELASEKEAFGDRLADLDIFTDAWLARQRRWQAEGLRLLDDYLDAQRQLFAGTVQGPAARPINPGPPSILNPPIFPGASTSRSSTINNINAIISIGDTGGRSDEYIQNLVEVGIVRALEKVAGG